MNVKGGLNMGNKVTVATTWLGGCSGCHISLLDTHEEILELLNHVDIKYSMILDAKEIPEVDVGIIEGSICNEENLHIALEFRKKAKIIVALGSCAMYGGIHGLRNMQSLESVVNRSYVDNETTENPKFPEHEDIPKLRDKVVALREVIKVDAEIPGCAPNASDIKNAILALVKGESLPELKKNVCEGCSRRKEKLRVVTKDFLSQGVKSPNELDFIDPELCFLEQGVLCMGPATREGCGAYCCEHGNMPCRGCYGPIVGVKEQGASMVNTMASLLPAGELMFNEDIMGMGYRFTLPHAMSNSTSDKDKKNK